MNIFGKNHVVVGDSSSDLILKTLGKIKILWGNKFIDLIKDGKINADCKFIYRESSVGKKDGIYVTDNGEVYLVVGNNSPINLKGEIGNTYVSFQDILETTPELKHLALQNIGFIYESISLFNGSILNGIIYIEDELKLYIVSNGNLTEFAITISNPFTKLFIIRKNDNSEGALVIDGYGAENSVKFNSMSIYCDRNSEIINIGNSLNIKKGETILLTISNGKIETIYPLTSEGIRSSVFSIGNSGYSIYKDSNNLWVLEIDKIIERSNTSSFPQVLKYLSWNIISAWNDSDDDTYTLKTLFTNTYKVGDILEVSIISNSDEQYNLKTYLLEVINTQEDSITVKGEVTESLSGLFVYLINDTGIIKILDNIDLITPDKIHTRIGNLGDLPIEGPVLGLFSDNAVFEKANYDSSDRLTEDDDSTSFASTNWVRKIMQSILPIGTIIAFHGENYPDGWSLCNGDNGTPDLRNKFIIGGESEKEGNKITITPLSSLSTVLSLLVLITPSYYSLVFIMKTS